MKIVIGADHAGFDLKTVLIQNLKQQGHDVQDVGAYNGEASDYPVFGVKVASAVSNKQADKGIVICGNGIGMSIVANKFPGVRAALVFTEKMAKDTREHNDSNVLSLAGRDLPSDLNLKLADIWVNTPFSNLERHVRRIAEITKLEQDLSKR
jgi:RpiB/LacA/LacB family sugar-phosphate isomerase